MLKINLINPNDSDVDYVRSIFPDGEPHIKFLSQIDRKQDYRVICRVANPSNLFELMQVGNILNRQAVDWSLDIMYLMSMRMDRVISFNEAFSLEIVADSINGLNPSSVRIFHPHSEKTLKLIHNSHDMEDYYYHCMGKNCISFDFEPFKGDIICYPDSGAAKRYNMQNRLLTITLEKSRGIENNGAIKSMKIVDMSNSFPSDYCGNIVVTDDLCDAGGTFVLAAKLLKEKFPNAKLMIRVRHAVNPTGIRNLSENYDDVVITNSYNDWDHYDALPSNVHLVDVVKRVSDLSVLKQGTNP